MLEDKNTPKTSIEQLGEFGLIRHLTNQLPIHHNSTQLGVGDDAAILDFGEQKVVVSTDMLVEGVHFDLSFMPLEHLGYKAVIVNLSDIVAMQALPTQITVSLALSNRFPLEAVEALYKGIRRAADAYKVDIVGGDTTSSQKGLIISITAIGVCQSEPVRRSGAQVNDLIVVSGDLGGSYMGLQILEREKQVFLVNPNNQPDLTPYTYLIERQLKPEARTDIRPLLQQLGIRPTSMIDISDGLSSELLHLCTQSGVGCQVYEDRLPMDPQLIQTCEEFQLDSTTVVMNGGEDYELLFTVPIESFDALKGNPDLTIIGHITEANEGCHLISRSQTKVPLQARGWNAFYPAP